MKTSGLVVVLAGASAAEAFLTAPRVSSPSLSQSSVTLRRSRSCQETAQPHVQYMVAAPTKEDQVAAVPHGGSLVDLNLRTEAEKKVGVSFPKNECVSDDVACLPTAVLVRCTFISPK